MSNLPKIPDPSQNAEIIPFIGVHDALSASIAAKYFDGIFCSGYGFAASHYGMPDEGFIAWPDLIAYVARLRAIVPDTRILVDIDDGYGDPNIAANVVRRLELTGASAVIIEDQRRPKKCGHLPGKEIITKEEYLNRLDSILQVRNEIFIVARTDADNLPDGIDRATRYAEGGADAVMVEGLRTLEEVQAVKKEIGNTPLVVNIISGGKTEPVDMYQLHNAGADFVIYSTPTLFPAQEAIEKSIAKLKENNGNVESTGCNVGLSQSNSLLKENLASVLRWNKKM